MSLPNRLSRLAALGLGLLLAAAGPATARPQPSAGLRFVIIPKVTHPWFDAVHKGAMDAARMIEQQSGQPVRIDYQPPAVVDPTLQATVLSRAIASRPDGISIDPLDARQLRPQLLEAQRLGIAINVFDSEQPESLAIASVGTDFCHQARVASRRLVALLGGKGEVAIMQGVPSASNHATRVRCHQEVFRQYPGIKVVATPSDLDDIDRAEREAVAVMKAHPGLRGWVASDASGPIGIGRAIRSQQASGRVVAVGLDDLAELQQQIRSGLVESSVASRPVAQGYWAMLQLWQQRLGAPAIERIDTGISLLESGKGNQRVAQ
jgi:ribose transport system substrate-binding protein